MTSYFPQESLVSVVSVQGETFCSSQPVESCLSLGSHVTAFEQQAREGFGPVMQTSTIWMEP